MKSKKVLLLVLLISLAFISETVFAAVTLVDFTAQTIDLKVILEWETSSESDMQYFVVLRSNQENGEYTQKGDFIYTQGSSESGLLYQYVDTNVIINKTYYYKLEAVDNDYKTQSFGPVSITVLSKTYTNTVTPSKTLTVTGTITPNTPTVTKTITPSPTVNLTNTPTSPFSFITNTATPSATYTSRFSPTLTQTPISETPEFTRTYEIISFHTPTPISSITAEPIEKGTFTPFQTGAIGFGATIVVGAIFLVVFGLIQKKRITKV